MLKNYKSRFLLTALIVIISLLLFNLPVRAFPQNSGGAGSTGGGQASGITMRTVSGRVVQTMNSGGYTYALVDGDGTRTWVALPKSSIAVGNEIVCQPGMVMTNFNSASLQRTFEQIVFSKGIQSLSAGTASPNQDPPPEEAPVMPKTRDSKDWNDFFK